LDITYYTLKLLSLVGIVKDLRPVPAHLLDSHNETWVKNQPDHVMFSRENAPATKVKKAPKVSIEAVAEEV
jgi:hypothetical protein